MDKRIRSPNYPALSLKDAVEKVSMLYRSNQMHAAPREVVAKAIGYNTLNGASATAISALNKYGLLEGRGEDLKVSDRAMSILHPHSKQERVEALKAAASEPKLFSELAERFPGGVQNDELLKNYLLRNGFAMGAVTQAIQAYHETSEFVALEAAGYDSSSSTTKNDAAMNTPHSQKSSGSQPPPPVFQQSSAPAEGTRVLQRFDFPDGGAVEIRVTRGVDALRAVEVIKKQLPGLEQILRMLESDPPRAASQADEIDNE